ncbi:MAG: hypothetical protein WA718_04760 [Terriglobales bacterium]
MRRDQKIKSKKRRPAIVQRLREKMEAARKFPDFAARLRKIYGDKILAVSGAELISKDRDRY